MAPGYISVVRDEPAHVVVPASVVVLVSMSRSEIAVSAIVSVTTISSVVPVSPDISPIFCGISSASPDIFLVRDVSLPVPSHALCFIGLFLRSPVNKLFVWLLLTPLNRRSCLPVRWLLLLLMALSPVILLLTMSFLAGLGCPQKYPETKRYKCR